LPFIPFICFHISLNPPKTQKTFSLCNSMGSSTSSIPAEPIVAAAALAGALGYGYVHYFRPAAHSDDEDVYSDANTGASNAPSTLRGQKKRGRKLRLPGDATLKNLDVLDAPVVPGSLLVSTSAPSKLRERQRQAPPQPRQEQRGGDAPAAAQAQSRDVVPGGFDGTVTSADDVRDIQPQPPLEQAQVQQQHVSVGTTKKPKKKKGKKAAATSDPSSASALGTSQSLATSTEGVIEKGKKASASAPDAEDAHDERWTRVEARRKRAPVQSQDGSAEMAEATAADVTTSDAGITTSVTGNSSPVTERTTEDELRSDPDECVSFFFLSLLLNSSGRSISDMCAFVYCRSALEASPSSLQDAPPHIAPVRPPPGEKPAKGFTWEDYEGVRVDENASSEEDGGWGVVRSRRSQFLLFSVLFESIGLKIILSSLQDPTRLCRRVQEEQQVQLPLRRHHSHSCRRKSSARMRRDERR
jgi:hypothetical protein